jgi:carboxyl-terminal processing protease
MGKRPMAWLPGKAFLRATALSAFAICNVLYAQDKQTDFGPDPAHVSLAMRMRVATSIKETVQTYFAHWEGAPDLDFDQAFDAYINEIARTDDRRSFDLATMALLAKLHNGHTKFGDEWLWAQSGNRTGLVVAFEGGQWVVINSRRTGIPSGSVITSIDGEPIEHFYTSRSVYISASSDRATRNDLFFRETLFPRIFDVGLASGKTVQVNLADAGGPWENPVLPKQWPDGVAYHRITSFGEPTFENDAIEFLTSHQQAKAIILDVRNNGGGSTPSKLLDALILKPYKDWNLLSAMSIGLLKLYAAMDDSIDAKTNPEGHGFADGMHSYFQRPMFYKPGGLITPSATPIYTGKLIVLADQNCASACEDFLMPLKVTGRATIIGDVTYGSSGQPKIISYGNGMTLKVSAKRMIFGDGTPFEGVGIKPDIELVPTVQQLTAHIDPVLAKALELARGR